MFRLMLLQAIIINQMRLWSLRVNIRHNLLMVGLNITNMYVNLTVLTPLGDHGTHDFLIQSRTLVLLHPTTNGGLVAARECLPSGANVCVAVPANQIGSAIRVFFRISDIGGVNQLLGSHLLPSPLIPSSSLFCLLPPSHSPPISLLSLKSRPL